MTLIKPREFTPRAPWSGLYMPDGFIDAWRQCHYAAQLVSEVGKGWAEPREDDAHSALTIEESRLYGTDVGAELRAFVDLADLRIGLAMGDGDATQASLELDGKTIGEGLTWIRQKAGAALGRMNQTPVPAPSLPSHPVANGEAFDAGNAEAFEAVASMYEDAGDVLRMLRDVLDSDPVFVWPHHFDAATLHWVQRGARSIGIGLTPPDEVEASGYWYVSPWSSDEMAGGSWPDLPVGRWEETGSLRMAVLPLVELAGIEDPERQKAAVAAFIAVAFNGCAENLPHG